MGKITIVQPWERTVQHASDLVDEERYELLNASERESVLSRYFPSSGEHLELFELELPAGAEVSPHAHDVDEVIYVTAGSVSAGAHVVGPGAAIYVQAHTLYGFRAGPKGCSFLNFRPRPGCAYLTRADVMAGRAARRVDDNAD